jgi:hypothetical protein
MNERNILINRAPVLTLWATTVAERLGFDHAEALSLGKALAGLTAQSKGRRLGIYKPVPQEIKKARARKRGEEFFVELCGRSIPAINTADGVRAVNRDRPVESGSVERYLESKFGDSLQTVRAAMRDLAKSFRPEQKLPSVFMSSSARQFQKERSAGVPKGNWILISSGLWGRRGETQS